VKRRALLAATLAPRLLRAQPRALRIGVLTDLTGRLSDATGRGSIEAVRLAAEEIGIATVGRPVEILSADIGRSPEFGIEAARRWLDEDGVEAIVDIPDPTVATAVQALCRARGRVALFTGPCMASLTGAACAPTGVQWTIDSAAAAALGRVLTEAGAQRWFLVSAEDPWGHEVAAFLAAGLRAASGVVTGTAPFQTGGEGLDVALALARASKADAVALCAGAGEAAASLARAGAQGLAAGQMLAAPMVSITELFAMNPSVAAGAWVVLPFTWNSDDRTRAWARRFSARTGRMPGPYQIGAYEAACHYLRAAGDAGRADGLAVARRMRFAAIESAFTHGARIRADGRVLRPLQVARVKSPGEITEPYDLLSVVRTLPADVVAPENGCVLLPE